jgi:hypothetical protein
MGLGEGLGDGLGVTAADSDWLGEGVPLALSWLLSVPPGVGVMVAPGENEDGPAEGGVDPEQAETAAEASTVMVPRRIMANLVLRPVPAMVVRTFMQPPQAPRQVAAAFSGLSTRNRHRKRIRGPAWPLPVPPRTGPERRQQPCR